MKPEIEGIIPPILGLGNDWTPFEAEVKERFLQHAPESYTLHVSVVIPVYNRIEKLAKTIAALTHQTYPLKLVEVVIADDGSSDNPESLIPMFDSYFPLHHIFQEDKGYRLSEIRNKGVQAANHNHIIILDCDMLPEPTLVESFMQYAHVSNNCVMIGGRRYVNTDHLSVSDVLEDIEKVLKLPSLRTDTGEIPLGDEPPTEDWRYNIYRATENLKTEKYPFRAFCGGNVCFHRSLLDQVGGFDESFTAWGAEDTEFGFRVYNHGYWFIPVEGASALHQEPPKGSNETDREAGRAITMPILIEKCPAFYRKVEEGRQYAVPKVSVYIPAYNCENFIEEAIESILAQTYTDFEIVVVNDGSTDSTHEVLTRLYEEHPRVRIFTQENGGISAASNTALSNCRGEYVLQLDSDDAILPNTLETLVTVLDQNHVGFVYGDSYLTDQTGKSYGRAYSWSVFDRPRLLEGMMVHHPRMFRMRDYRRITGFDESLSNAVDFDLYLKLAEVTDGYHLQTPLYLYRQHDTNTSRVHTGAQDSNTHRTIINAFTRLGLENRVELEVDPSHPRKMILSLNPSPDDPRINLTEPHRRLGIANPTLANRFLWDIPERISPGALARQIGMTAGPNRFIRLGSFGSPTVAVSVASRIEHDYDMKTELQSVKYGKHTSYFIIIDSPKNDRQSLELRQKLQDENGWISEVVSNKNVPLVRARNQNNQSILDTYENNIPSDGRTHAEPEKEGSIYDHSRHWIQEGNRLIFRWDDEEVFFDMPQNWSLKSTHEDLLRLAHYVLVAPWDRTVIEDWVPRRKPGWRPGLAFSGGVDSAAAMALMPSSTVLLYNERADISGQLNHSNAFRFFDEIERRTGRKVLRIRSNHEKLRTRDGKMPGFSSDYACGVQVILLADHFGLDSLGTGMPLENSYLWHGYKYRDFEDSWFWKYHRPLFESVGLPLYQPVVGCSEIINMKIVQDSGWEGWAQSCLRSRVPGKICGQCWKCFRKNSLVGRPFSFAGEIETFLSKRPLKQAASTLFSIQKGGVSKEGVVIAEKFPDIKAWLELDFDFLNRYIASSLELLPPRYRRFTKKRLSENYKKMSKRDLESLRNIDFSEEE